MNCILFVIADALDRPCLKKNYITNSLALICYSSWIPNGTHRGDFSNVENRK
jgi:hypothetical protein